MEAVWNYTLRAKDLLRMDPSYKPPSKEAPYGKWKNRAIIGRDSAINGGVDVGPGIECAIVIDDNKQPELLEAYDFLLEKAKDRTRRGYKFKEGILNDAYEVARELIPYDRDVKEQFDEKYKDKKVELGNYIGRGGVCRQQALLAGYLLEKLRREGLIKGKASIDRNNIPGEGGHQWVRYVNSANEVFIIDPAQGYIGPLKKEYDSKLWDYKRPRKRDFDPLRNYIKQPLGRRIFNRVRVGLAK